MYEPTKPKSTRTAVGKVSRHVIGGYNDGQIVNNKKSPMDLKTLHVQIKDFGSMDYRVSLDLTKRLASYTTNKEYSRELYRKWWSAAVKKNKQADEAYMNELKNKAKSSLLAFDFLLQLNEDMVFVPDSKSPNGYNIIKLADHLSSLSDKEKEDYVPNWAPVNNMIFRFNMMSKTGTACSSNKPGEAKRWFRVHQGGKKEFLKKPDQIECKPYYNEDGKEDGCWYFNKGMCKRNYKLFMNVKGIDMGSLFLESTTHELCDNYRDIVSQIANITYSAYGYPITTNIPIRVIMYTKKKKNPVSGEDKMHIYYDFIVPRDDESLESYVLSRTSSIAKSINMFKKGQAVSFEVDEIDEEQTRQEFHPNATDDDIIETKEGDKVNQKTGEVVSETSTETNTETIEAQDSDSSEASIETKTETSTETTETTETTTETKSKVPETSFGNKDGLIKEKTLDRPIPKKREDVFDLMDALLNLVVPDKEAEAISQYVEDLDNEGKLTIKAMTAIINKIRITKNYYR